MSEKRFLLKTDKTTFIIDKSKNHRIRDMYKSCEVLNELYGKYEKLKHKMDFQLSLAETKIKNREKENEQLRHKLECCEYQQFLEEQNKIMTKVEKGDVSDFGNLTISDEGLEHFNSVIR